MREMDGRGQPEMNPETTVPEETKVIIIRSLEEIPALENPNEVRMVYLSSQEAIAIDTITELLKEFPNLTEVSLRPSFAKKISLEAKKILAEKDIELKVKYLRDFTYYHSPYFTTREDYLAKKEIYEDALGNPEKEEERRLLLLLNEYNFNVAKTVEMYFGEKPMSIGNIAQKTGIKDFEVYRDMSTLLHLIGYLSSDPNVLSRSKKWLRKLEKAVEEPAWLQNYQVGEIQPPKTLSWPQWEMWQKIMQLREADPKKWSHFEKNHPDHYYVLVNHLQLDEARGTRVTLKQIAKHLRINRQAASDLKRAAFNFLFSPEEIKIQKRKLFPKNIIEQEAVKKRYEKLLTNPDKEEHKTLEMMRKYTIGFKEVVNMYLEKDATKKQISRKLDMSYMDVLLRVAIFQHLVGYPVTNQDALKKANKELNDIAELEKAIKTREAWERSRESYAVDDLSPPGSLQEDRWETWQKIVRFRNNNPNEWEQLKKQPLLYQALIHYFQLREARGKRIILKELYKHVGLTHKHKYAYYANKDKALDFLGLLESEE